MTLRHMTLRHLLLLLVAAACAPASTFDARDARFETARPIDFTYSGTVKGLEPGAVAKIWIPQPRDSKYQMSEILESDVPGDMQHAVEPRFGNAMIYTEATANEVGEIQYSITHRIRRIMSVAYDEPSITESERALYLEPSAMVPVDDARVTSLAGTPVVGENRLAAARRIYDAVDAHVRYDKPENGGWGRGDTLWVCDSRHGNCTDFHSLFIAMCRSEQIPARFEIGFSIPLDFTVGEVGGYHCWAWFDDGEQWVSVDISEADKEPGSRDWHFGSMSADRVGFTVGRDINLVPRQAADPINFFIHPHVEVGGEVHTNVSHSYSYAQPANNG